MSANFYPILLFVFAIGLVLFGIIKLKINPFLILPTVGILTGLASGLPIEKITKQLGDGFGNTLGSIGLMVGLGIILGNILSQTGATEQIARLFIKFFGTRYIYLAIGLTGYVVCIPVFFQAAFIMFLPLLRDLSRKANIPFIGLLTALTLGCLATHCIVIPTPGPLAVMGNMSLPAGSFLALSLLVALPPTFVGVLAARYFAKQPFMQVVSPLSPDGAIENDHTKSEMPSGGLSLLALLLPIILILFGSLMKEFLPESNSFRALFTLIGDKNIAMLIGLAFAVFSLKKYFKKSFDETVLSSGAEAGLLILIVGAGGAFGEIIKGTGIANNLVALLSSWNLPLIWTGFLLTAIIRIAIGSATASAVMVSSIMAGMMANTTENPVMIGLAICCGSVCFSFPNDSGFWVIAKFSGLTVQQNLRMLTLMSGILGVVGFITVLILNMVV
jgi:gluconate:H+ symporter, GntP family